MQRSFPMSCCISHSLSSRALEIAKISKCLTLLHGIGRRSSICQARCLRRGTMLPTVEVEPYPLNGSVLASWLYSCLVCPLSELQDISSQLRKHTHLRGRCPLDRMSWPTGLFR